MLIPYDNDVIIIPKRLLRSFADDVLAHGIQRSPQGQEAPELHDQPQIEDELTSRIADKGLKDSNRSDREPSPEYSDVKLRFINSDILPNDKQLAIRQDDSFNLFFYRKSRKLTRVQSAVIKSRCVTVWKNDPLERDTCKNSMVSILQSIKLTASDKNAQKKSKVRRLPILPISETILPENESNILRFREISCWDLENGVLSVDLPAVSTDAAKTNALFSWIPHVEFDAERGAKNLQEFFRKEWRRDPAWKVYIRLQDRKYKAGHVTCYVYETCWSIPTRKQPVPIVSASIYFTMDVCSRKQREAPIIVSCHFENSPMILDPLKINFGGDILMDIIERKQVLANKLIY